MERKGFPLILEQLAQAKGISTAQVRQKLQQAMDAALADPAPAVQAMWRSVPCQGDQPTLDEFMEHLIDQNALLP